MCLSSGADEIACPGGGHPGHDDDTPARWDRDDRASAALRPRPKVERCLPPVVRPKFLPRVAGLLGRPHRLADKRLRTLGALGACRMRPGWIWNSSSRVVMVVGPLSNPRDGARRIEIVGIFAEAPAGPVAPAPKISNPTNPHASNAESALLSCRPWPVSPSSRCPAAEHAMIPDKLRGSAI